MSNVFKEELQRAHQQGDYGQLLQRIPYAKLIGIECSRLLPSSEQGQYW